MREEAQRKNMKKRLEKLDKILSQESISINVKQLLIIYFALTVPTGLFILTLSRVLGEHEVSLRLSGLNLDFFTVLTTICGVLAVPFSLWQIQIALDTAKNEKKQSVIQEIIDGFQKERELTIREVDENRESIGDLRQDAKEWIKDSERRCKDEIIIARSDAKSWVNELKSKIKDLEFLHHNLHLEVAERKGVLNILVRKLETNEHRIEIVSASVEQISEASHIRNRLEKVERNVYNVSTKCTDRTEHGICNASCKVP